MYRLSDGQLEAVFRSRRLRVEANPRFESGALRGGRLRVWLPALAHSLLGSHSDRLATTRYLFSSHKYATLIEALPREAVALLATRRTQLRWAREREIAAQSLFDAQSALARNYPEARDREALDRAYDVLVRALRGEANRVLVLKSDSNPINRLLVFAAREAGLRSLLIQHGILGRNTPSYLRDGWYADFTAVYDSHQAAILCDKGRDPARLPVLGFYQRPIEERLPPPPPGRARRICVLGQPFFRVDEGKAQIYLEMLRTVFATLREGGLEPQLKPHPREQGAPYLAEFGPLFEGSIEQAIVRFDVLIAAGSTALVEATLAGRVAIQVFTDGLGGDPFDMTPYAHLLAYDRVAELPELCLEASPVENSELELLRPDQVARRFVELVDGLGGIPRPYANPTN